MPGLIVAAPASGSGKTLVTLGLLRAFRDRGVAVRGAKSGPDYIDPRFHEAACGAPSVNLDAWAMSPARLRALAATDDLLIVEGAMGLFDGAAGGGGSVADLAKVLGLPVVLVVDAARIGQSVAALVAGFAGFDPEVRIAGVILNRTGSERHVRMLRQALDSLDVPVLGAIPRDAALAHPSRHLGLVQAEERDDLDAFLAHAGRTVAERIDLHALEGLARPPTGGAVPPRRRPPGQRIAVARDAAFGFSYPHLLADWREAGAEIAFFSPLADETVPGADFVYLPGGYPELHAQRLSVAQTFMQSLRKASQTADVVGECGGYMVLGDGLVDAAGTRHAMAGLLRLETSFAAPRLHLGYRRARVVAGPLAGPWAAHEFHYARTLRAEGDPLLTDVSDAEGADLLDAGLRLGRVSGSFLHLIEPMDLPPAGA
ncbi:cobyrinate a,c-diamide synthase [Wenxinia marina]|uniref:Hydrogenobyrinate a,c-diamide synthase n=1 Tax=Wenxinia marina DSM 24838 TaxID=1123501 RepID=A0A0D0Q5P1_9RHOB|nr:cobyrinate a,c-diamide synthase [Wenxinia marina]KIQ67807.1 cobyrinic acid a,c-diamide synthase [Wenxinia marina DSM 24838]GGL74892.1 hydrogenobyrinate a,c-diamide synthase [Wenxinia marina]